MASALLRAQLRSTPANGHSAFIPHIRKVVVEFCQHGPSSANTRIFISKDMERVARENPHVEFVVKQRNGHEPIARGFYANGRDKVIPLQRLEVNGVERKVQLILESSGAKIKPLKKGRIVESVSESVRAENVILTSKNTPLPHALLPSSSLVSLSSSTMPPLLQSDILTDALDTDAIVNVSPSRVRSISNVSELSPVTTLSDLPDVIPEHDEYHAMPYSLRHVLTPPTPDPSARPRSILLESALSQIPQISSRPRWSPSSESPNGAVFRARQSVSSIGSCSTVQTRSGVPIKSILTRHDSGVSMATTTKSTRRKKKRSPPSVKFVDAPTVYYDNAVYYNTPPPRSPPSLPSRGRKPTHWFTKWWKKPSSPPPRPPISGPYHISYTASLVDVYTSRPPKPKPGRIKQLWQRLTSVIS